MSDLNIVVMTGRLTRDCELRYTPNGTAVNEFSIASNRFYRSKKSEETEKDTVYMDCTLWGRPGESLAEFLGKGQLVSITGRIAVDTWKDDNDNNKRRTYVNCSSVNILGPKSNNVQPEEQEPVTTASEKDAKF